MVGALLEHGGADLDVADCDVVFNLELPSDAAHYAHRAGRTGRAGKDGLVVSIITERERFILEKFEKPLSIDIEPSAVKFGALVPASAAHDE